MAGYRKEQLHLFFIKDLEVNTYIKLKATVDLFLVEKKSVFIEAEIKPYESSKHLEKYQVCVVYKRKY